jgi:tetratricopeptide (TPR) repeat protein
MTLTDFHHSVPIVLGVQNEAFRERLAALMQEIGYDVERVGSPDVVYQLTREQYSKSWVLLDTEDDVAWLVQLVNDYHRNPFHIGGTTPIICVVSEPAFQTSPRLGAWPIGGSAAVFAVWFRERDLSQDLHSVYRFLQKERTPDPEPEPPTYDDLVTRVLQAPTEGRGLLDLGVRLEEWQDSHGTRYEIARAFLRHAVLQMPDSAEARRRYGASLFRTQRDDGLFHLREAVRLAPDDAEGYLALGRSLVEVDRPEALKILLTAVQLDPDGSSGRKARNVISTSRLDNRL